MLVEELNSWHTVGATQVTIAELFSWQRPLKLKIGLMCFGMSLGFFVGVEQTAWKREGESKWFCTGSITGGSWLAQRRSDPFSHHSVLFSYDAGNGRNEQTLPLLELDIQSAAMKSESTKTWRD